jgi:hypothetical protein
LLLLLLLLLLLQLLLPPHTLKGVRVVPLRTQVSYVVGLQPLYLQQQLMTPLVNTSQHSSCIQHAVHATTQRQLLRVLLVCRPLKQPGYMRQGGVRQHVHCTSLSSATCAAECRMAHWVAVQLPFRCACVQSACWRIVCIPQSVSSPAWQPQR